MKGPQQQSQNLLLLPMTEEGCTCKCWSVTRQTFWHTIFTVCLSNLLCVREIRSLNTKYRPYNGKSTKKKRKAMHMYMIASKFVCALRSYYYHWADISAMVECKTH